MSQAVSRAHQTVKTELRVQGEYSPMTINPYPQSEAYPGDPALQIRWDEYLDAVDLANRSGEPADRLTAARLYLTYAQARDAQDHSK